MQQRLRLRHCERVSCEDMQRLKSSAEAALTNQSMDHPQLHRTRQLTQTNRLFDFEARHDRPASGLKRVLHADDDRDILELTHLALDELGGLEVRQLPYGTDVIETALRFKPDLILLDVMMPDISGEELIGKIRITDHLKDIVVVFMTAKGNQMAKDRLLVLGASAVVVKPFDPTVLADQLREIYDQASNANRT